MATAVLEEEEFVSPTVLHLIPPASPEAQVDAAMRDWAQPKPHREPVPKQALDALAAVASVLTVRLVLALAVAGAFALAVLVIQHPTTPALVALGFFTALIAPLCWLAQKRVT